MVNYIFLIVVLVVLALSVTFITLHGMTLTNEQYDRLKAIVIKWSAITTLLGVIVATFKVTYGAETITVVAAIGAFLARCLDVSIANYRDIYKGEDELTDEYGEEED